MDLVADRFFDALTRDHAAVVRAEQIRPRWRRLATSIPLLKSRPSAFTADRLINRFWHYPRYLSSRKDSFDLYHICDHSYSHLARVLPAQRTGVACHDLDAFRPLWDAPSPARALQRQIARHLLSGLQKAAVVFCDSRAVVEEIKERGLLDSDRLVYAPHGVSDEFSPHSSGGDRLPSALAPLGQAPYLLHVGSCIPRKRIDVLLEVFSGARRRRSDLHLVQVGGKFNAEQEDQIRRLNLAKHVHQIILPARSEATIAAIYRRAELVLLPSAAEGFGFVVIEALACGRPVIASDHPVLHEVGGSAASYCPIASVPHWVEAVEKHLTDPSVGPSLPVRLAQAKRFSWEVQARTILEAYAKL